MHSYIHAFGTPSWFITMSPNMRNNIMALRIGASDHGSQQFECPEITARAKKMIDNPVSASRMIYRLLEKFF